jgi:hypothetical protein
MYAQALITFLRQAQPAEMRLQKLRTDGSTTAY